MKSWSLSTTTTLSSSPYLPSSGLPRVPGLAVRHLPPGLCLRHPPRPHRGRTRRRGRGGGAARRARGGARGGGRRGRGGVRRHGGRVLMRSVVLFFMSRGFVRGCTLSFFCFRCDRGSACFCIPLLPLSPTILCRGICHRTPCESFPFYLHCTQAWGKNLSTQHTKKLKQHTIKTA